MDDQFCAFFPTIISECQLDIVKLGVRKELESGEWDGWVHWKKWLHLFHFGQNSIPHPRISAL